jgi:hypothetical protein
VFESDIFYFPLCGLVVEVGEVVVVVFDVLGVVVGDVVGLCA